MCKFLRADICKNTLDLRIRRGITLIKIAQ